MQLPDTDWPYVCYTSHPYPEVCAWCVQNIGQFNQEWYKLGEDIAAQIVITDYKSTYMFRDQRDAVLFELRWA
jgi:hypothetical protein